jgi:hypothetical protein
MRGWVGDDTDSAEMLLRLKIGRYLRDRLDMPARAVAWAVGGQIRRGRKPAWRFAKSEWSDQACADAGHWLLETAMALSYFALNEKGFPAIAPRRVGTAAISARHSGVPEARRPLLGTKPPPSSHSLT